LNKHPLPKTARLTGGAELAGKQKNLVIVGPTASGKSAAALAVAERIQAEILSVDSMQVYRAMDIGTAKPTPAEQTRIKHHLIDLVDPSEVFTVARFVELADTPIEQAQHLLVITGGTPLYYKALFEGLFEGPGADESIRARLRQMSNESLRDRLLEVDPDAGAIIHLNDHKRLVRALEVYELTGKPISSFQTDWATGILRHDAVWIGLSWDREILNRRINARTKQMIEAGWLDETRRILDHFGGFSATASEATGYRELVNVIHDRQTLDEAVEQIKIATRQLARRQMKWFRRWPQIKWIAGDRPLEKIVDEILTIHAGSDPTMNRT
jgi:tRNA dimethylallyltransferase